jgi:acyl-coenzyme A thioesterase PaaI-like protein
VASIVARLKKSPEFMHSWLLSTAFGLMIPYAGRSKVRIQRLTAKQSIITIKNRRSVQNHIGGIHATAMAIAAESATGYLVGMNVSDACVPVIKTLKVDYEKRCKGSIKAVAELSDAQLEQIKTQEKGEVTVSVVITDEENKEPVQCEMIWAWTPKRRS